MYMSLTAVELGVNVLIYPWCMAFHLILHNTVLENVMLDYV